MERSLCAHRTKGGSFLVRVELLLTMLVEQEHEKLYKTAIGSSRAQHHYPQRNGTWLDNVCVTAFVALRYFVASMLYVSVPAGPTY